MSTACVGWVICVLNISGRNGEVRSRVDLVNPAIYPQLSSWFGNPPFGPSNLFQTSPTLYAYLVVSMRYTAPLLALCASVVLAGEDVPHQHSKIIPQKTAIEYGITFPHAESDQSDSRGGHGKADKHIKRPEHEEGSKSLEPRREYIDAIKDGQWLKDYRHKLDDKKGHKHHEGKKDHHGGYLYDGDRKHHHKGSDRKHGKDKKESPKCGNKQRRYLKDDSQDHGIQKFVEGSALTEHQICEKLLSFGDKADHIHLKLQEYDCTHDNEVCWKVRRSIP